ncbi:MAG: hypothetical protein ABT23_13460 [Thiobacillus sp. SCN 63-57]|nr:MAG: hypothetical protein ABT23_13460 [Thiobacillus sp. SCN 63-57]
MDALNDGVKPFAAIRVLGRAVFGQITGISGQRHHPASSSERHHRMSGVPVLLVFHGVSIKRIDMPSPTGNLAELLTLLLLIRINESP